MGKSSPERPVVEGRSSATQGTFTNTAELRQQRLELFQVERPARDLAQLILPKAKIDQLRSLLTKIRYQKLLYEDFGLNQVDPLGGRTAINFYGPPGTGKSFAAEAVAAELEMNMIRVNYAEIESKFVGETAKNIQAAFEKAETSGAMLFFDEADSILGQRLTQVRQSTDHAVNVSRSVMLLALDRFDGVTIFATNLASNYDSAFVRRILGHIEFPLPSAALRRRLWHQLIPEKYPSSLSAADLQKMVRASNDLSGGDLLNVVINAAASALEREGAECQVVLGDFQKAIRLSKEAKKNVGRESKF
jgi:SpoVK/Ycf46/Vps4 family AAA+-type ATPase